MSELRAAVVALAVLSGTGAAQAQTWNFEVRLDGKPIGTHRFEVTGSPEAREVTSTARFDVKLLGITVFRYRHEAQERWRGDCLRSVRSRTDDDGQPISVDQERGVTDCVMSYAYWHPALIRQQRLLNPQTGEVDEVRFERLPDGVVPVAGRDVEASRWRITTTPGAAPNAAPGAAAPEKQDLTLWRDRSDGRWIGLDARVKGGRVLTYRLP